MHTHERLSIFRYRTRNKFGIPQAQRATITRVGDNVAFS